MAINAMVADAVRLWAVGLADPCADPAPAARRRVVVASRLLAGDERLAVVLGEFVGGVAVGVAHDDRWRVSLPPADNMWLWWADVHPLQHNDFVTVAGRLAPVPDEVTAEVIGWALSTLPGRGLAVPTTDLHPIEFAVRVLLARFRACEPGVDLVEFVVDVIDAAITLAAGPP